MDIIEAWDESDLNWPQRKILIEYLIETYEIIDSDGDGVTNSLKLENDFGNSLVLLLGRLFKCLMKTILNDENCSLIVHLLSIFITSTSGVQVIEEFVAIEDLRALISVLEKHPIKYKVEIESILHILESLTRFSKRLCCILIEEVGLVSTLAMLLRLSSSMRLHDMVCDILINCYNLAPYSVVQKPVADAVVDCINSPRLDTKRSGLKLLRHIHCHNLKTKSILSVEDLEVAGTAAECERDGCEADASSRVPSASNSAVLLHRDVQLIQTVYPQLVRLLLSRCVTLLEEVTDIVALCVLHNVLTPLFMKVAVGLSLLSNTENPARIYTSGAWEVTCLSLAKRTAHHWSLTKHSETVLDAAKKQAVEQHTLAADEEYLDMLKPVVLDVPLDSLCVCCGVVCRLLVMGRELEEGREFWHTTLKPKRDRVFSQAAEADADAGVVAGKEIDGHEPADQVPDVGTLAASPVEVIEPKPAPRVIRGPKPRLPKSFATGGCPRKSSSLKSPRERSQQRSQSQQRAPVSADGARQAPSPVPPATPAPATLSAPTSASGSRPTSTGRSNLVHAAAGDTHMSREVQRLPLASVHQYLRESKLHLLCFYRVLQFLEAKTLRRRAEQQAKLKESKIRAMMSNGAGGTLPSGMVPFRPSMIAKPKKPTKQRRSVYVDDDRDVTDASVDSDSASVESSLEGSLESSMTESIEVSMGEVERELQEASDAEDLTAEERRKRRRKLVEAKRTQARKEKQREIEAEKWVGITLETMQQWCDMDHDCTWEIESAAMKFNVPMKTGTDGSGVNFKATFANLSANSDEFFLEFYSPGKKMCAWLGSIITQSAPGGGNHPALAYLCAQANMAVRMDTPNILCKVVDVMARGGTGGGSKPGSRPRSSETGSNSPRRPGTDGAAVDDWDPAVVLHVKENSVEMFQRLEKDALLVSAQQDYHKYHVRGPDSVPGPSMGTGLKRPSTTSNVRVTAPGGAPVESTTFLTDTGTAAGAQTAKENTVPSSPIKRPSTTTAGAATGAREPVKYAAIFSKLFDKNSSPSHQDRAPTDSHSEGQFRKLHPTPYHSTSEYDDNIGYKAVLEDVFRGVFHPEMARLATGNHNIVETRTKLKHLQHHHNMHALNAAHGHGHGHGHRDPDELDGDSLGSLGAHMQPSLPQGGARSFYLGDIIKHKSMNANHQARVPHSPINNAVALRRGSMFKAQSFATQLGIGGPVGSPLKGFDVQKTTSDGGVPEKMRRPAVMVQRRTSSARASVRRSSTAKGGAVTSPSVHSSHVAASKATVKPEFASGGQSTHPTVAPNTRVNVSGAVIATVLEEKPQSTAGDVDATRRKISEFDKSNLAKLMGRRTILSKAKVVGYSGEKTELQRQLQDDYEYITTHAEGGDARFMDGNMNLSVNVDQGRDVTELTELTTKQLEYVAEHYGITGEEPPDSRGGGTPSAGTGTILRPESGLAVVAISAAVNKQTRDVGGSRGQTGTIGAVDSGAGRIGSPVRALRGVGGQPTRSRPTPVGASEEELQHLVVATAPILEAILQDINKPRSDPVREQVVTPMPEPVVPPAVTADAPVFVRHTLQQVRPSVFPPPYSGAKRTSSDTASGAGPLLSESVGGPPAPSPGYGYGHSIANRAIGRIIDVLEEDVELEQTSSLSNQAHAEPSDGLDQSSCGSLCDNDVDGPELDGLSLFEDSAVSGISETMNDSSFRDSTTLCSM